MEITSYFLALCSYIAKTARDTTNVTTTTNRKLHGLSNGTKYDDLG